MIGTLDLKDIDLTKAAHLCIDVQVGYCDPEHKANEKRQELANQAENKACYIRDFSEAARNKSLTNIWCVHASSHLLSPWQAGEARRAKSGNEQRLRRSLHIVSAADDEIVMPKWSFDAFDSTPLERWLNEKGKDILFLSGNFARECISASAITGNDLGFRIYLLRDLIQFHGSETRSPEIYWKAMEKRGIGAVESWSLLAAHP